MLTSYQRKLNEHVHQCQKLESSLKELYEAENVAERHGEVASLKTRLKQSDGAMIEFLLDSTPFLSEYSGLKATRRTKRQITEDFQRQFDCPERKFEILTDVQGACKNCGSMREYIHEPRNAETVCETCGLVAAYGIAEGTKGLTHEQRLHLPPAPYTYKPLQHFIDMLNNVEATSAHRLPKSIVKRLREKFELLQVRREDITPKDVRLMLRQVKACRYYEDTYYLTRVLNPTYTRVEIPVQRKDILKNMFREVYPRFRRNAVVIHPTRKNFLSYPYVAYKFCELCGWRDYMRVFPLLKSREKLRIQDRILKRIFAELDWHWTDTI